MTKTEVVAVILVATGLMLANRAALKAAKSEAMGECGALPVETQQALKVPPKRRLVDPQTNEVIYVF